MNILNKISIKNIKLNKKRTISTIIGIILSVALICAVATMATSFQATLVEDAVNSTGYWHLSLFDITEEDINELNNNRDIKEGFKVKQVGYAKLDNCKNEEKPYVNVYSMSDATFKNLHFNLVEGRFPANNNEIIISNHIMTNGEVNLKIGDEITLGIGKRIIDGDELRDSNPYMSGEEGEEKEELQVNSSKKFKIVGIIERPNYSFENYTAPSYTVITTNMDEGHTNVYLSLKDPKEYKTSISELLGAKDYKEVTRSSNSNLRYDNFDVNTELLRWEVFAFSDSTVSMIYAVIGVVIFIIVFTSVFCIRNSFAISITEKIKMYGMLASIGATKKQIRKNVIFEGFLLGLIGIPLGILSGIFAVFVLIQIMNMVLEDVFKGIDGFVMNISIMPIILSVLLGFVTIYISSIASAIKASRTSPIEQIRNSSEIKIKAKKLKTPKIIKKVFKIGGVLAYKNLKRSKKKYRTTVISIAVSIFVFITMNAFITNAFEMSSNYYEDYDYNVEVSGKISDESLNSIKKLNYIDEIFITYQNRGEYIEIEDLTKVDKDFEKIIFLEEENDASLGEKREKADLMIIGLDDETFRSYTKKIGEDYEKVKNKGILCDNYKFYGEDDKLQEKRIYNYEKNDIIEGKFEEKPVSITIGAVTSTRPYGWEQTYYSDGYIVVNANIFTNFKLELSQFLIESSNPEELVKEIKKVDSTLSVTNLDSYVEEQRAMTLIIKIFLYGFIAVITLIGVTNIFNTITSNMELRQKEFAMLKSVGMTKKEFNRMINLETIFYSTKALIYGILMGILGTFAMYKAFNVKLGSDMYIPLNAIGISIVFVFILVFVIMRYSINKINKQNTIETIRKDNI